MGYGTKVGKHWSRVYMGNSRSSIIFKWEIYKFQINIKDYSNKVHSSFTYHHTSDLKLFTSNYRPKSHLNNRGSKKEKFYSRLNHIWNKQEINTLNFAFWNWIVYNSGCQTWWSLKIRKTGLYVFFINNQYDVMINVIFTVRFFKLHIGIFSSVIL